MHNISPSYIMQHRPRQASASTPGSTEHVSQKPHPRTIRCRSTRLSTANPLIMDEWDSPWADPTPTSPSAKPPQHTQHKPHTPWDEDDGAVWSASAPEEWEEEDGKHMAGKGDGEKKVVKRMESSGSLGWREKADAWGKEQEGEGEGSKLPGTTLNRKISVPDWGSVPEVEETKGVGLRLPDRMLGRKMSVPDWGDVEEAQEPDVVGKPEKQQPTLQHKMSADWGEEDKVAGLEIPGMLRHKMSVPDWGAVEEEPEDVSIPEPVQTLKHQPSMPDWGAMEDVVEQKSNGETKKVVEPVMGSLKHQPSVPDWGAVEVPVEHESAVERTHPEGPADGAATLKHRPSIPDWGAVEEEVAEETAEVKPAGETGKVEGPATWEHHSEEAWRKDEEHLGTDQSRENGSKAEEEKPVEAAANIEAKDSTYEELVGSPAEEPESAPEKQEVLDVEALPDVPKVSETLTPTPALQENECSPPVAVEVTTATKETEEEEEDDDFGDFAEEDSETSDFPTSPVVAAPPTFHDILHTSHDIPPLAIDFNLINKLYPIPTSAPTHPPLEPYIIHSTSARKSWYRLTTADSLRKTQTGSEEDYVRVTWRHSKIQAEVNRIVTKWVLEDRLSGKPRMRGSRSPGAMFGWANGVAETEGEARKRMSAGVEHVKAKQGHARTQSDAPMKSPRLGMVASPTVNFGWGSTPEPVKEVKAGSKIGTPTHTPRVSVDVPKVQVSRPGTRQSSPIAQPVPPPAVPSPKLEPKKQEAHVPAFDDWDAFNTPVQPAAPKTSTPPPAPPVTDEWSFFESAATKPSPPASTVPATDEWAAFEELVSDHKSTPASSNRNSLNLPRASTPVLDNKDLDDWSSFEAAPSKAKAVLGGKSPRPVSMVMQPSANKLEGMKRPFHGRQSSLHMVQTVGPEPSEPRMLSPGFISSRPSFDITPKRSPEIKTAQPTRRQSPVHMPALMKMPEPAPQTSVPPPKPEPVVTIPAPQPAAADEEEDEWGEMVESSTSFPPVADFVSPPASIYSPSRPSIDYFASPPPQPTMPPPARPMSTDFSQLSGTNISSLNSLWGATPSQPPPASRPTTMDFSGMDFSSLASLGSAPSPPPRPTSTFGVPMQPTMQPPPRPMSADFSSVPFPGASRSNTFPSSPLQQQTDASATWDLSFFDTPAPTKSTPPPPAPQKSASRNLWDTPVTSVKPPSKDELLIRDIVNALPDMRYMNLS